MRLSVEPSMKLLTVTFILVASVASAQDIGRLLPDSLGGLAKSDSTGIFAGDELYRLIDGGADIFREYGFARVMVQRYSDSGYGHVDLELYEMEDSTSAYGIFSLIAFNTGEPVDFAGEANAGDCFFLFWKGKYYASLTASDSLHEKALRPAAEEIARRITCSEKPKLVSLFHQMKAGTTRDIKAAYIKGKLGLYNLTTISFGGGFRFEDGICLSTAAAESFVFAYDTETDCRHNLFSLAGHLRNSSGWNAIGEDTGSYLFATQDRFLKAARLGKYLVVTTSQQRVSLEEMSAQILSILNRN